MKLNIDEIIYNVEVFGDLALGTGPPLLLLHGFTGSIQNWRTHASALVQQNRSAIAVDLLGHGETRAPTDPQGYAMAATAKSLAELLQKLGLDRVHLLGYSMGGRLALYMAIHYHKLIATLTLESASPGLASAEERATRKASDNALANWIEANGIPAFVERWEKVPLFDSQKLLPATVRAGVRKQRLQNSVHGLANSLRGMGTGVQPSLWPHLVELKKPVHLIVGALDTKFVAINQCMADLLPDVQLSVVDGTGHTVHLEKAAEFDELVIKWLSIHNLKK